MSECYAIYAEALRRAEAELAEVEARREALLLVVDALRYALAAERVCEVFVPARMMALLVPSVETSESREP